MFCVFLSMRVMKPGALLLAIMLLMLKTCDCKDDFIDETLESVYEITKESYEMEVSDCFILEKRQEFFVTETFSKISILMPEKVEIPKLRGIKGRSDFLCIAETTISLKVGGIRSLSLATFKEHNYFGNARNSIVATSVADAIFKDQVTFQTYKEKNSHHTEAKNYFCEDSSISDSFTYKFTRGNTVQLSLSIPDFSQDLTSTPSRTCIIYIEELVIDRLKPIFSNAEVENKEKLFWTSMKEDIYKMMNIGIKNALLRKRATTEKLDDPWICFSDNFLESFRKDLEEHYLDEISGKIIYEKFSPVQFLSSFQLGIEDAVTTITYQPEEKDYLEKTSKSLTDNFQFKFTTYAPNVFEKLRQMFGIEKNYYLEFCCKSNLIPLANPGKSRSSLYLSENKMFIFKALKDSELTFLQNFLNTYFTYSESGVYTLLPKFLGLYSYNNEIHLVVMNNLMPNLEAIGQKYDLKGSFFLRYATDTERAKTYVTFKDQDFIRHHPHGIFLRASDYDALIEIIGRDTNILKTKKIVDYSLLLGLQYIDYPLLFKDKIARDTPTDETTRVPCELPDSSGATSFVARRGGFQQLGIPAWTANGKQLVLFVGIIDMLQEYNWRKIIERFIKPMIYGVDNEFSIKDPEGYATRFANFMSSRVFKKMELCPRGETSVKL